MLLENLRKENVLLKRKIKEQEQIIQDMTGIKYWFGYVCYHCRQKYTRMEKEKEKSIVALTRKLELQNYQIESLKSMLKQYIVRVFAYIYSSFFYIP